MKGIDIIDPSHATRTLAQASALGIIPKEISNDQEDEEEEKRKKPRYMKKGGTVSSASSRADGCAERGKTRGRFV
jgi:hypothetical protein